MRVDEYSTQAIKTASCDEGLLLERIYSDSAFSLLHAALGMCSEAGEVFEWVNSSTILPDYELIAELGDCLWYLNLLSVHYSIPLSSFLSKAASAADERFNPEECYENIRLGAETMCVASGQVCDQTKALIFYGRFLDLPKLTSSMTQYLSGLVLCCRALKVTLDEAMDKNISKLRARYGETFSEERANSRDLKQEQAAYSK